MIEDDHYNALCEIAAHKLPNLAHFAPSGEFVGFADDDDIVEAATAMLESVWKIEIDTGEYNDDDRRGIVEAYRKTHITAGA